MQDQPGGLDIVVCNHRTPDDLEACLRAIEAFPPAGEFTVSVVHTVPDREDLERSAPFVRRPGWHEIVWEDNVGYNRACNHAGARGTGEYIAFLNADAAPTERAFDQLTGALAVDPTWAMIGPRQVNSRGELTWAGTFGTNEKHAHRAWHAPDSAGYGDVRDDAVYVAGSFLVMPRRIFDELTDCPIYRDFAPDEPGPWGTFAHYSGDQWLGFHARAHGYLCTFYGPVRCRHEWHRASARGGYGEENFRDGHELLRKMCAAHDTGCNTG